MKVMALYIRNNDQRTKLQDEIAANLKAKAATVDKGDKIDESKLILEHDAHDSYLKNSKSSSALLGVWLTLGVVGVAVVLYLVIQSS